jgi:hypothetical protein
MNARVVALGIESDPRIGGAAEVAGISASLVSRMRTQLSRNSCQLAELDCKRKLVA